MPWLSDVANLVVIMIAITSLAQPNLATGAACAVCGDVNCDGSVDAVDALLIAQTAAGLRAGLPCGDADDVSIGPCRLIREVAASGSNMSQHALEIHVGLGTSQIVDTLEIHWPSGTLQTLRNVQINQRRLVREP